MLFANNSEDQNKRRKLFLKKHQIQINLSKYTPTQRAVVLAKETKKDGVFAEEELQKILSQIPRVYKKEEELTSKGFEGVFDNDKKGITIYKDGELHSQWSFRTDKGIEKLEKPML